MANDAKPKPWDSEYPAVSYSESQDRRRRRCARSHYHSVFTAHQGWRAKPHSDSWRAYRAKKAVPLSTAVGTAVHEAAGQCVEAIRKGSGIPSFDALRATAAASLNARWRNSRRNLGGFMREPKRVPVFLEALYGDAPTRSDLLRANQVLDRALWGLVRCEIVWYWVRSAEAADVIVMAPFTSVEIMTPQGKTTCYGAADLIVRPSPTAPWHIIDFKTGSADGVVDQILTYALVARDSLHLSVATGCTGVVVALGEHPDDAVSVFWVSEQDLAGASQRLQENIEEVRSLLANQQSGAPRPIEAFPQTLSPRACSWCAFRVLCHPDQVAEDAIIASRPIPRMTAA
ncbi:MAG: PD-(D/E)XK nuclease family protein [Gemmatimonadota bacterium]|nr:PD-(D/E)XK nuclease family protein [Gemmatimonadota bacterium]